VTNKEKSARAALDRLADAIVEDILNMSDEEVLEEFREDHGDPEHHAAHMRELFEATLASLPPPIEYTLGYGLLCHLWQHGGAQRERARAFMRRKYSEGIQYAFCYYEYDTNHVAALRHADGRGAVLAALGEREK
jgi:hypothetical protein